MHIVVLDKQTLCPQNGYNEPLNLSDFEALGTLQTHDKTLPHQTVERVKNANIIITNKVKLDQAVLDQAKQLKMIAITATGMNNVDLPYANSLGIVVKNVAGYSTNSVAQHTMMMALYLSHNVQQLSDHVQSGKWSDSQLFTFWSKPFVELAGKKWGIIGLGTIGKEVAKLASAFGCEILTYSPSGNAYDNIYKQVSKQELLTSCAIISIHSPLNEHTKYLISKRELELLQYKTVLINVARGGIIDENDLAKVIDTKEIFVGLDVLEQEPIASNHPLLSIKRQERLLITPHTAWASVEARATLMQKVYVNIKDFCNNY